MAKRYEELTIADDFMFGKTMGDKVLCKDVLEQLHDKSEGDPDDALEDEEEGE